MLDDETSVGLAIDVYQESINSYWTEYLVNYDYLTQLMSSYGFIVAPDIKDLPHSICPFRELFTYMNSNMEDKNTGQAKRMTPNEKRISFLNNLFIYKKISNPVKKKKKKEKKKKIKKLSKTKTESIE